MEKRSGKHKVGLVPRLSSYHSELQKRVAIIGVSLIVVLILVGIGLYVKPEKFVGKVIHFGTDIRGEQNLLSSEGEETLTYTWDGTNWALGDRENPYCSSTNFCVGIKAPRHDTGFSTQSQIDEHCTGTGNFCEEDTYCYEAGSIVYDNLNNYCSPNYGGRNYVWISCEENTRYYLTEDSTFICDDPAGDPVNYRWLQCTTAGEVRGNFRCDGNVWQECGDGAPYLCGGGYTEVVECNEDIVFDTQPKYDSDNAVVEANEYYCSYDGTTYAWIACTRDETLGEGVENGNNPERYGNNYVCSFPVPGSGDHADDNFAQWQPIPQCAVCAGNAPGECVGSSTLNVRTGEFSTSYYNPASIDNRVSCVTTNECYTNGREYLVNERSIHDAPVICGAGHTFLRCSAGLAPVTMGDGEWLCETDATLTECDESRSMAQVGSYICSYDAAAHNWKWYSEYSCSPQQKYQVRDANQSRPQLGLSRICDGTSWITCEDRNELEDVPTNPFADPDVEVTCDIPEDTFDVTELTCNNDEDDDKDGLTDCDDDDCAGVQPVLIGKDDLDEENEVTYEKKLRFMDCFGIDVAVPLDETPPPSPPTEIIYSNLKLCDQGTEVFGNRATLCHTQDGATQTISLDSTALLQARFGQPRLDTTNNLGFLFEQGPPPKIASVMYYQELTPTPTEFNLGTFSSNLANGQRILLGVDEEVFILSHPAVSATVPFLESNLRLKHIATGADIAAELYPGTNVYVFRIPGDRLVQFHVSTDEGTFEIAALPPGEAPQSFAVPMNLFARFEVTFSKASPVRIFEPAGLGIFSVCRDDNAADPQQVKVCQNNNYVFSLRAGTLTDGSTFTGGSFADYAFLFEVVNNDKQVSIFPLKTLLQIESGLAYDAFVNAMVAGRRVAVKFNGQLYLLQHPTTQFLSLPSVNLIRYISDARTTFPAIGSLDTIDFLIPDGKITLDREYGTPPPPFKISALRLEEIAPVNLNDDLSTSLSSLVPVIINKPSFGTISSADTEFQRDENVFKINYTNILTLLRYRQPQVLLDEALFYYHTAAPSEGVLLKQASIYRLYALDTTPQGGTATRAYNDLFIRNFVGGKEFAVKLDDDYYLVGYENNNNEVLSFNINRVRLSALDRSATFPAIPEGDGVRFDLPNGKRMGMKIDYTNEQLQLLTGAQILAASSLPGEQYMAELTTGNQVDLTPANANDLANTFRMCFLDAYAGTTSAKVCSMESPPSIREIVPPRGEVLLANNQHYFLQSNEMTGNDKKVFIRRLFNLKPNIAEPIPNWVNFIREVVADRKPIYNVSNTYYFPSAENNNLENFGFTPYPSGSELGIRNLEEITPVSFKGHLVLGEWILFIEQKETTVETIPLKADLRLGNYRYLPEDNSRIYFNFTRTSQSADTTDFITRVGVTVYRLGVTIPTANPTMARVTLTTVPAAGQGTTLINRLFREEENKILHLDGTELELEVEWLGPNPDPAQGGQPANAALISLKRR